MYRPSASETQRFGFGSPEVGRNSGIRSDFTEVAKARMATMQVREHRNSATIECHRAKDSSTALRKCRSPQNCQCVVVNSREAAGKAKVVLNTTGIDSKV